MNEPQQIPLSDRPRSKEPKKIRLLSTRTDFLDYSEDENYKQDDKTSVPKLESDETH
jgi:hypothetical protein